MATNSSCTTSPPIATSDSTTISDCTIVTPSRVKCKTYTVKMKLEAVKFGMLNSKADAARKYNVDPKRIREWTSNKRKLEELISDCAASKKKRLSGGGRKVLSHTMEDMLAEWIAEMRGKSLRVSRKMLQIQAMKLFNNSSDVALDAESDSFEASNGWLQRFFTRHHVTLRKRTTLAQKLPELIIPKLENFILYVRSLRIKKSYLPDDIIAMDETAVWLDMPGETTVDLVGVKSVPIRTTGHEKNRITVCLAAKASGRKLQPLVVFKGKRLEASLESFMGVKAVMSANGWMNQDLTNVWLNKLLGTLSFRHRLLVWDSFRCHISDATKSTMKKLKIDMAVIPGGCTGIIQAPDVSWNATFKARIRDKWDTWMSLGDKTFTKGGNMRAPTRIDQLTWVKEVWNSLDEELIKKSFITCALNNPLDVPTAISEIHCLKEGEVLHSSLGKLIAQCAELNEKKGDLTSFNMNSTQVEDVEEEPLVIILDDMNSTQVEDVEEEPLVIILDE